MHNRNTDNSKCCFPRCEELRNSAGLSKAELARKAVISVDLIRSMENGNAHSRHKVMRVVNVLQGILNSTLDPEVELKPPQML
jgi:ribosome-binding protein aMBF1 (putative translation factor)